MLESETDLCSTNREAYASLQDATRMLEFQDFLSTSSQDFLISSCKEAHAVRHWMLCSKALQRNKRPSNTFKQRSNYLSHYLCNSKKKYKKHDCLIIGLQIQKWSAVKSMFDIVAWSYPVLLEASQHWTTVFCPHHITRCMLFSTTNVFSTLPFGKSSTCVLFESVRGMHRWSTFFQGHLCNFAASAAHYVHLLLCCLEKLLCLSSCNSKSMTLGRLTDTSIDDLDKSVFNSRYVQSTTLIGLAEAGNCLYHYKRKRDPVDSSHCDFVILDFDHSLSIRTWSCWIHSMVERQSGCCRSCGLHLSAANLDFGPSVSCMHALSSITPVVQPYSIQ